MGKPNRRLPHNQEREARIPTDWIRDLNGTTPEEFEQAWRNSTFVLNQLKTIIERELQQLYIDLDSDYQSPNWDLLRTDKNGRIRAYERIYKLLP